MYLALSQTSLHALLDISNSSPSGFAISDAFECDTSSFRVLESSLPQNVTYSLLATYFMAECGGFYGAWNFIKWCVANDSNINDFSSSDAVLRYFFLA